MSGEVCGNAARGERKGKQLIILNIIGRECINTFLGKSIFLVPENQQVMVGSLGFFDLIFISPGTVLLL